MRNLQRVFAALCGVFALGLGILGVGVAVSAPGRAPVLLEADPGVPESAQSLLEAVSAGDLDAVSAALAGSPTLTAPEAQGTQGEIWNAYLSSITYQIQGSVYGTNQGPALDVTLTALDLDRLCQRVRELVPQMLERQIAGAQDISELYDSQNGYRQDVIDRVLSQSLHQALKEDPAAKETRLTLHFSYSDGVWQVQPESGLVAFLSGNMSGV